MVESPSGLILTPTDTLAIPKAYMGANFEVITRSMDELVDNVIPCILRFLSSTHQSLYRSRSIAVNWQSILTLVDALVFHAAHMSL